MSKILVIGSGAREHALAQLLANKHNEVHCAQGNGGTDEIAVCHPEVNANDFPAILALCKKLGIDLVVVGPEEPLVNGITDYLSAADIKVFGPTKAAARLEGSKIFAKEFMLRHGIPTSRAWFFNRKTCRNAFAFMRRHKEHLVVKADGLCGGKGVTVQKETGDKKKNKEELVSAAKELMFSKKFGAAGESIVVEEKLKGKEYSFIVLTDGVNVMPFKPVTDYKRRHDGDSGPNTGGMGCFAPPPGFTREVEEKAMERIILPTIRGLAKEKVPYVGFLYFGLIHTRDGVFALEYNVREGDPEAPTHLPLLESDLSEIIFATVNGDLAGVKAKWSDKAAICRVIVTEPYPYGKSHGEYITGIDEAKRRGALVFHAGTKKTPAGGLITDGGRIVDVVGIGKDFSEAYDITCRSAPMIKFESRDFRGDIGYEVAFSAPWGTR